jgi:hypothetical protein
MQDRVGGKFWFIMKIESSAEGFLVRNINYTSYHSRCDLAGARIYATLQEIQLISNLAYFLSKHEDFKCVILLQDTDTHKYFFAVQ